MGGPLAKPALPPNSTIHVGRIQGIEQRDPGDGAPGQHRQAGAYRADPHELRGSSCRPDGDRGDGSVHVEGFVGSDPVEDLPVVFGFDGEDVTVGDVVAAEMLVFQ